VETKVEIGMKVVVQSDGKAFVGTVSDIHGDACAVKRDDAPDSDPSIVAIRNCTPLEERPLFLTLIHGRNTLDEELSGWGFDGPCIGPFYWLHTTYMSTLQIGNDRMGTEWPGDQVERDFQEVELPIVNDLLCVDGKFYGDWEVVSVPPAGRTILSLIEVERLTVSNPTTDGALTSRTPAPKAEPAAPPEDTRDPHTITVCRACGSDEVQWLDWVEANTGNSTASYESNDPDDTWCPGCEEHAGTETFAAFVEDRRGHPNLKCDSPDCPGWLHMTDSMGRGPGIERCDTCSIFRTDAAARMAHDLTCPDGKGCEFRS